MENLSNDLFNFTTRSMQIPAVNSKITNEYKIPELSGFFIHFDIFYIKSFKIFQVFKERECFFVS